MAGVVHSSHALQGIPRTAQRFPGRGNYVLPGPAPVCTASGPLRGVSPLRRDDPSSRASPALRIPHYSFRRLSPAPRRPTRRRAPACTAAAGAGRCICHDVGGRRVRALFLRARATSPHRPSAAAATGRVPQTGRRCRTAVRLFPGSSRQCRQRESISLRHRDLSARISVAVAVFDLSPGTRAR